MAFAPQHHTPAPRPVVVTGAGIVTALGEGWETNATGFREGRVALGEATLFDTSHQRVHIAGQAAVPLASDGFPAWTQRRSKRSGRASRFLVAAGLEAVGQAGWNVPEAGDPETPIVLGTSAGGMDFGESFYRHAMANDSGRRLQHRRVVSYQPQSQALDLAAATGAHGPVSMISNACASGANAIGHAFRLVASGRADRVLAGGYDALSHLVFAGFDSLQALSTTTPRPFARDRDGLAIGEGAAIVAIESADSAAARDATVLAEIAGYGAATDIHHLTQPSADGSAAVATMNAACTDAGIAPGEVDYINSHGTGTPLNDAAEANAIRTWAGDAAPRIAVSSTKGSIGHLLGGAGAVESVVCLMALGGGWIPPNVALPDPDPITDAFDLVTAPRDRAIGCALTNSFGFGGANATLIFRRMPV